MIYYDDDKFHTLLKYGIRSYKNEVNPNYPMMAWDPKGTRIAENLAEAVDQILVAAAGAST